MGTKTTTVLYVLLLAAVIVVVDVLFFRNAFWERLAVNTGIVLIFTAVYFRFLKRPLHRGIGPAKAGHYV